MHTRTKRRQKKLGHVLLYPLPEAIASVKQLSFSAGLMDDVNATRKREGTYDATTVQVAALNQCAQFQTHHMDGKTGTNNPRLFKELFIPTYTHGREAWRECSLQRMLPCYMGCRATSRSLLPTSTPTPRHTLRSLKRPLWATPSTCPHCRSLQSNRLYAIMSVSYPHVWISTGTDM